MKGELPTRSSFSSTLFSSCATDDRRDDGSNTLYSKQQDENTHQNFLVGQGHCGTLADRRQRRVQPSGTDDCGHDPIHRTRRCFRQGSLACTNCDARPRQSIGQVTAQCLVTDGDADRLGVGDENGQFINQLRVFGLLAYYLLEVRGQRGAIVKTLSTTSLLDKLGSSIMYLCTKQGWASNISLPR